MYNGEISLEERVSKNKDRDVKCKFWAFLIYPDDPNNPKDWLNILRSQCIPCVISPLHDLDVSEKTGELVKPHYHVMVQFDISQRITFAQRVSDLFTGSNVEAVKSPSGYYFYMDHSHEDDKVKYNRNDMILIGGFNPDQLTQVSKAQLQKWRLEIEQYIFDNNITEYWDLCTRLAGHNMDLKDYCDTHTIEIRAKLSSFRNIMINKERHNT